MEHPKDGMRYKDALKTCTRHAKEGSYNIVASMANQVARHEGTKGAIEFVKEVRAKSRND